MSKDDHLNPYERLANAVVLAAVRDFREAFKKVKGKRKNEVAKQDVAECLRFFRSPWFRMLTDIDPEYLIERLYEEVA